MRILSARTMSLRSYTMHLFQESCLSSEVGCDLLVLCYFYFWTIFFFQVRLIIAGTFQTTVLQSRSMISSPRRNWPPFSRSFWQTKIATSAFPSLVVFETTWSHNGPSSFCSEYTAFRGHPEVFSRTFNDTWSGVSQNSGWCNMCKTLVESAQANMPSTLHLLPPSLISLLIWSLAVLQRALQDSSQISLVKLSILWCQCLWYLDRRSWWWWFSWPSATFGDEDVIQGRPQPFDLLRRCTVWPFFVNRKK